MIGSAHRFNQIGLDTRSQFEQVYIKKCYGYDAFDFFSKNLAASNKATFWKVLKHVLKMPRNEFLLFDENQQYDFYKFPDIPRPDPNQVDIEALGSLQVEEKDDKRQTKTKQHLGKAMQLLIDRYGLTQQQCADELDISQQQVSKIMRTLESESD
jgi:uncharacterized membrane protein